MEVYLNEIEKIVGEKNAAIREEVSDEAHIYWGATYVNLDDDDEPERIFVQTGQVLEGGSYLTIVLDVSAERFSGQSQEQVQALARSEVEAALAAA